MIEYTLDRDLAVLHVRPTGPLRKADFDSLAQSIDPFIEQAGSLRGLLLEVVRFPGWEDIGAAVRHIRFVRDHHRSINKVAIVTDSVLGEAAENIASHFVAEEIQHFSTDRLQEAKAWLGAE